MGLDTSNCNLLGANQSDLDTPVCCTHHKLSVGTLPAPTKSDLMHLSGTQPEKALRQICLDSCCGPRHTAAQPIQTRAASLLLKSFFGPR